MYCTDQVETSWLEPPRFCNSMKSFFSVAPLLPPPPYTSFSTTPVEAAAAGAAATRAPSRAVPAAVAARIGRYLRTRDPPSSALCCGRPVGTYHANQLIR